MQAEILRWILGTLTRIQKHCCLLSAWAPLRWTDVKSKTVLWSDADADTLRYKRNIGCQEENVFLEAGLAYFSKEMPSCIGYTTTTAWLHSESVHVLNRPVCSLNLSSTQNVLEWNVKYHKWDPELLSSWNPTPSKNKKNIPFAEFLQQVSSVPKHLLKKKQLMQQRCKHEPVPTF